MSDNGSNRPRGPVRPFSGMLTPEELAPGTELTDREPQFAPSRLAADYASEGRLAAALPNIPLGEPPTDVDVRSVYDARPIQGFDFNIPILSTEINIGPESGFTSTVMLRTTVPHGYVAVVRRLHHSFRITGGGVLPPITARNQVLATMTYQDAAVPFNANIPVGLESDDIVNCFYVCDEDTQFGVTFFISGTDNFTDGFIDAVLYGNLIRKTGRPAPQEIGNPVAKRGGK